MHLKQSIFPTIPSGQVRALDYQSIQIDGMEVQFDEKIALFPVNLEVVKQGDTYTTRRSRGGSERRSHE